MLEPNNKIGFLDILQNRSVDHIVESLGLDYVMVTKIILLWNLIHCSSTKMGLLIMASSVILALW